MKKKKYLKLYETLLNHEKQNKNCYSFNFKFCAFYFTFFRSRLCWSFCLDLFIWKKEEFMKILWKELFYLSKTFKFYHQQNLITLANRSQTVVSKEARRLALDVHRPSRYVRLHVLLVRTRLAEFSQANAALQRTIESLNMCSQLEVESS